MTQFVKERERFVWYTLRWEECLMKKRLWLMLLCIMAAVMLSACHVDNDPWPTSDGATVETSAPSEAPQMTVPPNDPDTPNVNG